MNPLIQTYITRYNLQPHPEGGWYAETYRSSELASHLPPRFTGPRHFSTAIYFLMPGNTFSTFHRIQSDELWHFYDGDMLEVFVINAQGSLQLIQLGRDTAQGQVYQATVHAGQWFASRCSVNNGFALVGCTVSPGFDFKDFEIARREGLLLQYPQHSSIIGALTR